MNEQRQQSQSDLDLWSSTNQLGQIDEIDCSKTELAPAKRGAAFASALKAKFDGTRPIIEDVIFATVEWDELTAGKNWLDVSHQKDPSRIDKPYYATSITNRSTEKIRIDRFGTYIQTGKTLVLCSITGGFYSRQQFQEWYELGDSQWLVPGQTVTDPNTYSLRGVYWAYFGTSASGEKFVAGAAWNGKPWWKFF
ncbi:hypothetical protein [Chamaesiphon sp. VAR_48_metabat_403]|uniref:hypothetical protein n=1 Tax=Chamaesiphon sp. VAR_48_metabat_403 TaxID=2964700 RepID=UPI00286E4102|nr:hypothetical protein [Chamaesiphon sp. VAR_48_metabat_403]